MKSFKGSRKFTLYDILIASLIFLTVGIVVVVIVKGKFPYSVLAGYGGLIASVAAMRRSASNYVAVDGDMLYIASNDQPQSSDCRYSLSDIKSLSFKKCSFWSIGSYEIMICRNGTTTVEVHLLGCFFDEQLKELCRYFENSNIEIIER